MKRFIILTLIFVLVAQVAFAYEPYDKVDFPQWTIKLRRAETLTFGALPITFALVSLTYGIARSLGANAISNDPLNESFALLGIAGGVAISIALTVFIIGEVKK